jgi:hypothetical protein
MMGGRYDYQQKALEQAVAELRKEGCDDPATRFWEDRLKQINAIDEYRLKLSNKYIEIVRRVEPRPLVLDNVKPKTQWGRAYYDD